MGFGLALGEVNDLKVKLCVVDAIDNIDSPHLVLFSLHRARFCFWLSWTIALLVFVLLRL